MAAPRFTVYGRPPGRRRWRVAALVLAVVVGALAGCGAWLARSESGTLPPGIVIEGIDVGGLTIEEARASVSGQVERTASRPIVLAYPGGELTTSGEELGVHTNLDEVLAEAQRSRGGLDRLGARLGLADSLTFALVYTVDEERLAGTLERVASEVDRRPVSAKVTIEGDQVVATPSAPGAELDAEAAAADLATLPARVELELREVPPKVDDEAADAARLVAETLLAAPPDVVYRAERLELDRTLIAEALRFRARKGAIRVRLDSEPFEAPLQEAFGAFEREPVDATFRVKGERAVVVPSRDGRALAPDRVTAEIMERVGARAVRARFDHTEPELTTREAKGMGIRRLVAEFTTPYSCCQPRVTNIQRAAEILDGQLIVAGGRFSLNQRLGERTAARGFVAAPMITAGRLEDAIGGGVSQIATTVYNAAFFAGLELIAHTPHQFYISRYPMGREATVSWGGPELIFRNDWPAGILVKVEAGDTSVTVRFYSSKLGRRVETETGEPYAYTAATTIREYNPSLPPGTEKVVQSGGVSGFTVEYTRTVYRNGEVRRDEHFTVRYDPEHTIVEYGPPAGSEGGNGNADDDA
ncbi:MAG: VanW family protein [Gaiellales bacterium]